MDILLNSCSKTLSTRRSLMQFGGIKPESWNMNIPMPLRYSIGDPSTNPPMFQPSGVHCRCFLGVGGTVGAGL